MEEDALVLDAIDHGESDLILTLFCRKSGRISAIAKGARKSRKRFVNKLEIFSFLEATLTFKQHSTLAFLKEAELHNAFAGLRHQVIRYYHASVIREYLLAGIKDLEPNQPLFSLTLWALYHLDRGAPPRSALALFLIRYFNCLGYRPDLSGCGSCQKPFAASHSYRLDLAGGRLLCSTCTQHQGEMLMLTTGTIRAFEAASDLPLERLHRVKLDGAILEDILMALQRYGNLVLQREIISFRYLK
jgi:DNA repair protein RecO (recombination protein O)